MLKLIQKFVADRSSKNARDLTMYMVKHPMAACMATPEQHQIIRDAEFKFNMDCQGDG